MSFDLFESWRSGNQPNSPRTSGFTIVYFFLLQYSHMKINIVFSIKNKTIWIGWLTRYNFCKRGALLSPKCKLFTLCDKVCQWLATGRCPSLGALVFSTNKTDYHDITEILLKVVLNTINQAILFKTLHALQCKKKHCSSSIYIILLTKIVLVLIW